MTAATAPAQPVAKAGTNKGTVREPVERAVSHDLVFAVVAHVGSGPSWVTKLLMDEIRKREYAPERIHVGKLLEDAAPLAELQPETRLRIVDRTIRKQDIGDDLRHRFGAGIVAALIVRAINNSRKAKNGTLTAYVIDQLKHQDEIDMLRSIYGDSLYVVSVVCGQEIRQKRLEKKYKDATALEIRSLMERDESGNAPFGQQVRKTLYLGDFFVSNESDEPAPVSDSLNRLLDIITGGSIVRPTRDERGMEAAWSASLRSACMSRQVGAAIVNPLGDILALGTNDVPRFGGGLYENDTPVGGRCFAYGGDCRNDTTKQAIYRDIHKQLLDAGLLRDNASEAAVRLAIERTRVRDLIEFSRAVHAEMDALISLVRGSNSIPQGSSLYCTTYPCHSCARHIVAAGLFEVVYIEPYPKSMATTLHDDAIMETTRKLADGTTPSKVQFRLFSGVAPRRFNSVFRKTADLKDAAGRAIQPTIVNRHVTPIFSKSYLELEAEVAKKVEELHERPIGAPTTPRPS